MFIAHFQIYSITISSSKYSITLTESTSGGAGGGTGRGNISDEATVMVSVPYAMPCFSVSIDYV